MNTKIIYSGIIVVATGLFLYTFILPFKAMAVDTVDEELVKLESGLQRAREQESLKMLRLKKQQLGTQELLLLQNFIPGNLHSGAMIYNLAQLGNVNRLSVKSLQYSLVEDKKSEQDAKEKKLLVEISLEGRYEDFTKWLDVIEKSNVLIDVVNIRAAKVSNTSEILVFNVKLYTYGINID